MSHFEAMGYSCSEPQKQMATDCELLVAPLLLLAWPYVKQVCLFEKFCQLLNWKWWEFCSDCCCWVAVRCILSYHPCHLDLIFSTIDPPPAGYGLVVESILTTLTFFSTIGPPPAGYGLVVDSSFFCCPTTHGISGSWRWSPPITIQQVSGPDASLKLEPSTL